tara:strand:+ start:461 stop:703 length:243 start_codon:yes stop_codon:yes gene_type:complete
MNIIQFFKENNGSNKLSSKRLAGISLITIGIVMAIDLYIISRGAGAGDAQTAMSIIEAILASGATLLGLGISLLNKIKLK